MENLIVYLIALIMTSFGLWYAYNIYKGRVKPALSTWMIFFTGGGLSLITYLLASNWNFTGGILNIMDCLNAVIIIAAAIVWSKTKVKLRAFEKWYLIAAGLITTFWLLTNNPFQANLLVQILIFIGYFPTIQKLVTDKKNGSV